MMPTTPRGTRSCVTRRPMSVRAPRTTWPIGSGRATISRTASAMERIRSFVRARRSSRPSLICSAPPRATSSALAARIWSQRSISAAAIASSPRFFTWVVAFASTRAASRAASVTWEISAAVSTRPSCHTRGIATVSVCAEGRKCVAQHRQVIAVNRGAGVLITRSLQVGAQRGPLGWPRPRRHRPQNARAPRAHRPRGATSCPP